MSAEPSVELPERTPTGSGSASCKRAEDQTLRGNALLAGTTIFDAASWNGIATTRRRRHARCKKCKVRVSRARAVTPVDPRAFSIES